jgi:hypothetical protein
VITFVPNTNFGGKGVDRPFYSRHASENRELGLFPDI